MPSIYAYFKGGEADGEVHPVDAERITKADKLVPPDTIVLDEHLVYVLDSHVAAAPDSYIYLHNPFAKADET